MSTSGFPLIASHSSAGEKMTLPKAKSAIKAKIKSTQSRTTNRFINKGLKNLYFSLSIKVNS